MHEAVRSAGASIIASRREGGVVAFGSDSEIQRVFGPFGIREIDIHSIEQRRLHYSSVEHGMLYDAICRALERERPLKVHHHRLSGHVVSVDPSRESDQCLEPLKQATKELIGRLRSSKLMWAEAIRVRLECRLDYLWLLIEPTLWVEPTSDDSAYEEGRDFGRRRLVSRYNPIWNQLLDAWGHVLTHGQAQATISAFGITDGSDATFTVSRITGFSRREGS